MKLGSAQLSADDDSLDLQRLARFKKIFEDQISDTLTRCLGPDEVLAQCGADNVLNVWELECLCRSLPNLGSLSENIDATTAAGDIAFNVIDSLAEFERALIAECTKAGLAAPRMYSVRIGRRKAMSAGTVRQAHGSLETGKRPADIAREFEVRRSKPYCYPDLQSSAGAQAA